MGWLFKTEMEKRSHLIKHLTEEWNTKNSNDKVLKAKDRYHVGICLKHCYRGNPYKGVLWSVREIKTYLRENDVLIETKRIICCDLMEYSKYHCCWGYKAMEETCGPNYYSCPLSYLEMVDEPDYEYAKNWRKEVRNYHSKRTLNFKISIGDKVKLKPGYGYEEVTIISVKPLLCSVAFGLRYKLPKKAIECKI